jgi:hypothetical protein
VAAAERPDLVPEKLGICEDAEKIHGISRRHLAGPRRNSREQLLDFGKVVGRRPRGSGGDPLDATDSRAGADHGSRGGQHREPRMPEAQQSVTRGARRAQSRAFHHIQHVARGLAQGV